MITDFQTFPSLYGKAEFALEQLGLPDAALEYTLSKAVAGDHPCVESKAAYELGQWQVCNRELERCQNVPSGENGYRSLENSF